MPYYHATQREHADQIERHGFLPKYLLPRELRYKATLDAKAVYFYTDIAHAALGVIDDGGTIFMVKRFPSDTVIIPDPEYGNSGLAVKAISKQRIMPEFRCDVNASQIGMNVTLADLRTWVRDNCMWKKIG